MSAPAPSHTSRLTAVLRDGERVTSLELFFDLVFVLTPATVHGMPPPLGNVSRGRLRVCALGYKRFGY